MFRRVNLRDNIKNEDKLILYKNSREEYCEIPIDYIDSVDYEFMQPSVIKLTVPNKTTHNGATIHNPIFDKILGKRQQMKFNGEVYVITDCSRQDKKDVKVISVTAKSIDVTLEDSHLYTPIGGMMRQLVKKDGEVETMDGFLNLFVQDNPQWKIGHVDESARKETNKMQIQYEKTINSINLNNVQKETVLFEQSFTDVNCDENNVVTVRFSFRDVKSYDVTTGKLLKTELKINELGNFHTGISKIKAIYASTDAYRYAIKYEVTLIDGTALTRECDFLDLTGYNVACDNIRLLFTNGTLETVVMPKYRNLEENVYNWRDILVNMITESFDCFVVFDCVNMTINCYDKKTFGESKGIYLSYKNFVKEINKNYQYDKIISKLEVESEQEGLSITDENPLGTNYLLDYSYFIENGIMSEECANAWNEYISRIDGVQEPLYDYRTQLNAKNSLKIKIETEMQSLTEATKGLEAIRVGFVKAGDTENANRLSREINANYDKIALLVQQLSVCVDEINKLKSDMQSLVNSIDMTNATKENGEKVFTTEDLLELQSLTISETLTDKYYMTAYGLYNNAKEILKERNKLQIDFTTTLAGLLQNLIIPKGLRWDYYISVGDKIGIDDKELIDDIRMTKITYIPKEFKITNITFTNRDKEVDDLKSMGNIGRTISRIDNLANNYRVEWEKGMTANQYIDKMLNEGLNLKASAIRSRAYSVVTDFSESGLFVIDGTNENNQLFLAGGIMAITNDRFETLKVCIDEQGIVAKQIVGEIILSHQLHIANENNSLSITNEGIVIEGNSLTIKGVEGGDYTFQSYFEMVKNQISLGVKDANSYTDSQIRITNEAITLGVADAKSHADSQIKLTSENIMLSVNEADKGLQSQITQNANSITSKVSNSDFTTYKEQTATEISQKVSNSDFNTKFTQTANAFDFTLGSGSTGVKIDKNGATVKNGALTIQNNKGQDVFKGDSAGNLNMNMWGSKLQMSATGDRVTQMWNDINDTFRIKIPYANRNAGLLIERDTGSTVMSDISDNTQYYSIYLAPTRISALSVMGGLTVSGSKNCLQKTENYGERLINAYETAEYYFGDLGFGTIKNGECVVMLDDIFQECVNTDVNYHVFTQIYNGCIEGIEKHKTYFIVKGVDETEFSWEAKAKRMGYENVRLDTMEIAQQDEIKNLHYLIDNEQEQQEIEDILLHDTNLENILLGGY